MAIRGRKRDENSDNQIIMKILFGKKAAKNQPTAWKEWPEPQRSIYSRMFSNHMMFFDNRIIKATNDLVNTFSYFNNK